MVEFREGEFQHALLPEEELPVHFAYKQVFVSALRQFPSLSDYAPRKDSGQEAIRGTIDPVYHLQFLKRAQLLGFRTEKILRGLYNAPEIVAAPYVEPVLGPNSDGEIIRRRWGRAFINAYKQFRTQLFLPNLSQARAEAGLNPSVLFVQQDLLNAFFGPTSEITATSTITVSATPAQVVMSPLVPREAVILPEPASAQIPRESVDTTEPVTPSRAEVPLAPEGEYYGGPREPSVSTEQSPVTFVSPESPEHVASEISISPLGRTAMEFEHGGEAEYEEAQIQSNTVASQAQNAETIEQRRSFIDVNSTTSEVSEGTTQNGRSVSETSTRVGDLDNDLLGNTESQVIPRSSPEIGTLEAEISQGHRSFLMPNSLNSPISAAGTEESRSSESQSSPAVIVSQRPRSFLSPERLDSPISLGYRPSEAWNSQDCRSFLTPRPPSPPSATSTEDDRPPETQSFPAEVSQGHRSFLAPEAGPASAAMSQSRRSFLVPEAGPASAAMSQSRQSFPAPEAGPASTAMPQSRRSFLALEASPGSAAMSRSRRSFLVPESGSLPGTEISGYWLSECPIPQAMRNSRDRRSFLTPEFQLGDQTSSMTTRSVPSSRRFEFIEYNGMRTLLKSTQDMDQYLQQRKGWIGMVIRQGIAKTMRFDHIVKHMIDNGSSQDETYALVKAPHAERFRRTLLKVTRAAEDDEGELGFASSSSNKRQKIKTRDHT